MTGTNIYKDIARRTNGDIYIGLEAPVTLNNKFRRRFGSKIQKRRRFSRFYEGL